MTNAHHIANTFDRGGLMLAGALHSSIQGARAKQMAADEEQTYRNVSAAQRAVMAVERQRRDLIASQQEAARLRAENAGLRTETARLRDELARMRSRALEAEGRLVRLAKEVQARRAA
jgi:regulator of replication initiation timing